MPTVNSNLMQKKNKQKTKETDLSDNPINKC